MAVFMKMGPLALLAVGLLAYAAHGLLVAPAYLSLTYGPLTLERAYIGLVAVGGVVLAGASLARLRSGRAQSLARVPIRLGLIGVGALVVYTAFLAGRPPPGGVGPLFINSSSPLAWLPSYMPWPILLLAWIGALTLTRGRDARAMLPLLLVGGIPALFYLPDALVTTDHPWMVRRLVPAVIPLLAMLATLGATRLYAPDIEGAEPALSLRPPTGQVTPRHARLARRLLAGAAVGLGLGLAAAHVAPVAIAPRHGAGIISGLASIAELLPADAIVVFPGSTAGAALAMPLGATFGIGTLAIPSQSLTPEIARVLQGWGARGIPVFWAESPTRPASAGLQGVELVEVGRAQIRWSTADAGLSPPPLRLLAVEHDLAIFRVSF